MNTHRPFTSATLLRATFALALLALVGSASAQARAPLAVVSRIEHREAEGRTTVILHGSQTPTFTVYKLERPQRLVVDLANTTLQGYDDPIEAETWAVGLITASRHLDDRSATARVIIGFRRAATYQIKARGT